jgi:SAM-dependent methyltransferase
MSDSSAQALKDRVRDFWNRQSCDTQVAAAPKFSREYFEQIEAFRYYDQPFIHGFAQFSRYRDKRVLEVGFGAGTDFIQWLRAGARASGIDLTPEALDNLTHRIRVYELPAPEQTMVADAEKLPFESNSFDLGYSFGVLHHSPNTEKAIAELVRVVRPGGEIKLMLYNRHSVCVFNQWMKSGLLRGKPFQSLKNILWHHFESVGTKAYTRHELVEMFRPLPIHRVRVHTEITSTDYLAASAMLPLNMIYRLLLRLGGYSRAWEPSLFRQPTLESVEANSNASSETTRRGILFTGNRFGFFHCISGNKIMP